MDSGLSCDEFLDEDLLEPFQGIFDEVAITLSLCYGDVESIVFIMGAVDSYIEDVLVVLASSLVVPLLIALRRILGAKLPLT